MTTTHKRLVLATSNPGKVAELSQLLQPQGWEVVPQSDLTIPDAAETGLTFVENALLKARHAAQLSGLPALADDSGLSVTALQGAPGIYSSRYAGNTASDTDNINKLLEALSAKPMTERHAQFHCVLTFLQSAHDPTPVIAHGRWSGLISHQPQGDGGFGYDPIFYLPEHGCTAAQLPATEKQQLSHRGQALATLQQLLQEPR